MEEIKRKWYDQFPNKETRENKWEDSIRKRGKLWKNGGSM